MECGDRGGGERERWFEDIFSTVAYYFLTRFRSMSRQSVIYVIETYNHIYRS